MSTMAFISRKQIVLWDFTKRPMTERLTKPVRLWQLVPDADKTTGETIMGPTDGPVEDPCDVAFVGPYSFVVADSVGHRLLLVDIARNVCSTIADRQVWPNGVAVTVDGKLLVTDRLTKVCTTPLTHTH